MSPTQAEKNAHAHATVGGLRCDRARSFPARLGSHEGVIVRQTVDRHVDHCEQTRADCKRGRAKERANPRYRSSCCKSPASRQCTVRRRSDSQDSSRICTDRDDQNREQQQGEVRALFACRRHRQQCTELREAQDRTASAQTNARGNTYSTRSSLHPE